MSIKTILMSTLFLLIMGSCKNDNNSTTVVQSDCQPVKKLPPRTENLNVSIFLDLSDRISPVRSPNPAMDYWKRDLGYIEAIVGAFQNHLRSKRVSMMDDNIKLRIHPLPHGMPQINDVIKDLD